MPTKKALGRQGFKQKFNRKMKDNTTTNVQLGKKNIPKDSPNFPKAYHMLLKARSI